MRGRFYLTIARLNGRLWHGEVQHIFGMRSRGPLYSIWLGGCLKDLTAAYRISIHCIPVHYHPALHRLSILHAASWYFLSRSRSTPTNFTRTAGGPSLRHDCRYGSVWLACFWPDVNAMQVAVDPKAGHQDRHQSDIASIVDGQPLLA